MLDSLLFEFCPTGWNGSDPTGPTGSTSSSAGVGVANPSEVLKIYSAAGLKPSVTTSTNGWIPISIPQSIDHLASAFPSALGRQLFHHYITETSKILITMGNSGPNPFLSLSEPLVLLDNNSPSSAALRMAILSTSVTHLKHITEDKTSIAPLIRWAVSTDDHPMSVLGNKFKKASLANLTMSMGSDNGSLSGEQGSDVVLATVVTIMTRDVSGRVGAKISVGSLSSIYIARFLKQTHRGRRILILELPSFTSEADQERCSMTRHPHSTGGS